MVIVTVAVSPSFREPLLTSVLVVVSGFVLLLFVDGTKPEGGVILSGNAVGGVIPEGIVMFAEKPAGGAIIPVLVDVLIVFVVSSSTVTV